MAPRPTRTRAVLAARQEPEAPMSELNGLGSWVLVSGLTSAATIWFLGALGILIGCSYPITGILLAVVVVFLLTAVAALERGYEKLIGQREGTKA